MNLSPILRIPVKKHLFVTLIVLIFFAAVGFFLYQKLVSKERRDYLNNLSELSHRVSVFKSRKIELSPKIIPAYEKGDVESTKEDLNGEDPVQLTADVLEAGRVLKEKPEAFFIAVYENIDYEPYYGAKKGSFETSFSLGANDLDQAALLIAYFRAAEIPARFVRGVIEISFDQAKNWFRVENDQTVIRILEKNGIPHQVEN